MIFRSIVLYSALSATALASTITGTVINRTTDKPVSGAEVNLLNMTQGLTVAGTAKTDANGKFKLNGPDVQAPMLVRVEYQGASYPKLAPPGTQSVDIDVFNAAPKLDGIGGVADIVAIQTGDASAEVIETYVIRNDSKPARTLVSDTTFQFYLPSGSTIESAAAGRAGGMPVNAVPAPQREKDLYAFNYALRPGESLFRIAYKLPYSGSIAFAPKLTIPFENYVVMLPTGMQLDAKSSGFNIAPDENGMHVSVVKAVQPGDRVAYVITGSGQIPQQANIAGADGNQTAPSGSGGNGAMPADNAGNTQGSAPGGGIGTPISTPDPLEKYKWWIFGGVTIALIAGAGYMMRTPQAAPLATAPSGAHFDRSGDLLEALKEEMFRLESDRTNGTITPEEYAKLKSALDLVLKRALANRSSTASLSHT